MRYFIEKLQVHKNIQNENQIIQAITDKDGKQKDYAYDKLSQLIREDDENAGTTTLYTYDNGGNLSKVTTYAYTTAETPSGTPLSVETYGYDSTWKDKLVSYNGQSIGYDAIGNPTTYPGSSLKWEDGRTLKEITTADGSTIAYTYAVDGTRIGKTVTDSTGTSTETRYVMDGDKILQETTGDETLYYSYDSGGKLWSIDYKKGDSEIVGYYVTRNAQGDICAIYNRADNTLVGTYQYDTWRNILSITPAGSTSDPNNILQKNPFRYRGYYYDNESGYYYLQSRYYNPEVRRFLNADNLVADTKNGLGYNLFAYSNNNPVNYKDESGHTPDTVMDVVFIFVDVAEVAANPANPVAWISLGADVACLIIPVASGGGAAIKAAGKLDEGADLIKSGSTTPNTGQGFSSKGYNPQPGERTLDGYVRNNANPEISLTTQSPGFNNNNGNVGGVFKRFGAESHGGVSPHVHQPQRNVAPNGSVYGSVGTKTSNGGVTSPSPKDVKQLYEYLNNGKYQ